MDDYYNPNKHTTYNNRFQYQCHLIFPYNCRQPIVTGTSVLAIKYKDGVMMAADCLASYGSLARFKDVQRITSLGSSTLMGTSGDLSDHQATIEMLRAYAY